MSQQRRTADSLLASLRQAHEGAIVLSLRGSTDRSRALLRDSLPTTLATCGSGAPVLNETERGLTLCFDLPLEAAFSLYWRMVECGLELDGESHDELTRLWAVQSHVAEFLVLERPCVVQLELRFRDERRRVPMLAAAARA